VDSTERRRQDALPAAETVRLQAALRSFEAAKGSHTGNDAPPAAKPF
jgi:hypothetical protein